LDRKPGKTSLAEIVDNSPKRLWSEIPRVHIDVPTGCIFNFAQCPGEALRATLQRVTVVTRPMSDRIIVCRQGAMFNH
jgi:hypothetical protein